MRVGGRHPGEVRRTARPGRRSRKAAFHSRSSPTSNPPATSPVIVAAAFGIPRAIFAEAANGEAAYVVADVGREENVRRVADWLVSVQGLPTQELPKQGLPKQGLPM